MRQQIAVKEIGDWLWVPLPKEIAEKYRLREGSVLDLLADHHGFAIHHYVGRRHRDHPISIAERAAESQVLVKAEPEHVPEASECGLVSKSAPPASATEPEDGFGLLSNATTGNATIEVRPGGGFFDVDEGAPQVPVIDEGTKTALAPKSTPVINAVALLRCTKLQPNVEPVEKRVGVPDAVYEEGLLEHPAIPGLMLTKDERLYGALLEMLDSNGVLITETFDEKRFRIKWKQPIPVAETESMKNFVKMHHESFADSPAPATPAPKSTPAADATGILRCTKLQPNITPLEKRLGVPDAVYEEGLLEHPAIPGLMLTKDERLYGALLELPETDGTIRTETFEEKRFRMKWKQPIPVADTESMKNFVKMHHESFGPPKNR